jgi:hypothetical protein
MYARTRNHFAEQGNGFVDNGIRVETTTVYSKDSASVERVVSTYDTKDGTLDNDIMRSISRQWALEMVTGNETHRELALASFVSICSVVSPTCSVSILFMSSAPRVSIRVSIDHNIDGNVSSLVARGSTFWKKGHTEDISIIIDDIFSALNKADRGKETEIIHEFAKMLSDGIER